jgi:hypothetical protein
MLFSDRKWRAVSAGESIDAAGIQVWMDTMTQQHARAHAATIASNRKIESLLRQEQTVLDASTSVGIVWPAWGWDDVYRERCCALVPGDAVQRALADDRDLAREGPAAGKSLAYSNPCGQK